MYVNSVQQTPNRSRELSTDYWRKERLPYDRTSLPLTTMTWWWCGGGSRSGMRTLVGRGSTRLNGCVFFLRNNYSIYLKLKPITWSPRWRTLSFNKNNRDNRTRSFREHATQTFHFHVFYMCITVEKVIFEKRRFKHKLNLFKKIKNMFFINSEYACMF